MRPIVRLLATFLTFLLPFGVALPVVAATSLSGASGLVKVPTASTLKVGELAVGFSWVGGERAYLFRPRINRMYYLTLGLLPGVELSLDMLQVIGWVDIDAPGVSYAFHRLSNLKYRLPTPDAWPALAVGVQDPFSANGLTRGPLGQTDYGLTTLYGVSSYQLGSTALHLGYAHSRDFIRGFFGGLQWETAPTLTTMLEYDSQTFNLGVKWQPHEAFGLCVARLFPDAWAAGIALSFGL